MTTIPLTIPLTISEAKAMAKRMRSRLGAGGTDMSHSQALELVAVSLGYKDWNTASARLVPDGEAVLFTRAIPILRIFDEGKAREFYCDILGFTPQFEHRFAPDLPLYMEVSRGGLPLHLSEHHGDASPGSTVFVPMRGIHRYCEELNAKNYSYARPSIEDLPWGHQMQIADPFGNRLRFCEMKPA